MPIAKCAVRPLTFLACLLVLSLLAAVPASADHVINQESVIVCRGCRMHQPFMDLSRGYPILLTTMSTTDSPEAPSGLLFTRSPGTVPASNGEGFRLSASGWGMTKIPLEPGGYLVNTAGRCQGGLSKEQCISLLFLGVGADNKVTALIKALGLDASGQVTGTLSSQTSLVPGLDGTPAWLDAVLTPDGGPHVAWWDSSGLGYTTWQGGAWLSDPLLLVPGSEVNWPFGSYPPTDIGYYYDKENEVYIVTDLKADENLDILDSSGGPPSSGASWGHYQTELPASMAAGESVGIYVGQGGNTPSATVVQEEQIVHYEDLLEAWSLTSTNQAGNTRLEVEFIAAKRQYEIYCNISGKLVIKIVRLDQDNNVVDSGSVTVEENFAGSTLVGAKRDEKGTIHICVKKTEDKEEHYESFDWIEVTIDESAVDWH